MALRRIWIPSPNYSGRGGASVRLIVLHTAEGALSYQSLGNYFANPSSQVSSHVGIDDTPDEIGEYVKPQNKAWTAANANPVAVQVELCAFAAWTGAEWDRHPEMLENVAGWIAEEASRYGIPITRLSASSAQGGGRGLCDHGDLGSWGGGHWDVGDGFPWDRVLDMAKGKPGAPGSPPAPEEEEDDPMVIATNNAGGQWLIWGSFRTRIANPAESDKYQKAGAKKVDWSEEMIAKFPIAENAVK